MLKKKELQVCGKAKHKQPNEVYWHKEENRRQREIRTNAGELVKCQMGTKLVMDGLGFENILIYQKHFTNLCCKKYIL